MRSGPYCVWRLLALAAVVGAAILAAGLTALVFAAVSAGDGFGSERGLRKSADGKYNSE
jgi:hypothetical protein